MSFVLAFLIISQLMFHQGLFFFASIALFSFYLAAVSAALKMSHFLKCLLTEDETINCTKDDKINRFLTKPSRLQFLQILAQPNYSQYLHCSLLVNLLVSFKKIADI